MRREIGFIGLGKLGLPCAEVMAAQHDVTGFDIEPRPTGRVRQVKSVVEAVWGKEFVFVAVPTPHTVEYDGARPTSDLPPRDFDYGIIRGVLRQIAPHLHRSQHVVVISTVLPGTCRRDLAPILSAAGANLIYNPYFVAMGTVERDFSDPEFVVLGTADGGDAAQALIAFYHDLIGEQCFHLRTWEEAEAIKVFYNTFISLKLGFVNMIQDVAMALGHIDVDRVTDALAGATRRIASGMYMRAGMGDGGPCHPRDNIALRDLSERLGLGYDLFSAVLNCREAQAENLARFVCGFNLPVVIIGRSFKPGVPYVDGSSAALTGHYVQRHGQLLGFIDRLTGNSVNEAAPATYLLAHAGSESHHHVFTPGSIIVDPWRACPPVDACEVIHYGNTRNAIAPLGRAVCKRSRSL